MHDYNGVSSQVRARRRTAKRGAPSRKNLIVAVCFLLLNMLIFILTFPVVVWLGAFPNIKMAAIESIGASGHQYLLHYLGMSQQEIEKLFNNQAGRVRFKKNEISAMKPFAYYSLDCRRPGADQPVAVWIVIREKDWDWQPRGDVIRRLPTKQGSRCCLLRKLSHKVQSLINRRSDHYAVSGKL